MYNQIIILGRIGKDPESLQSKSGSSYCRFSVVTNSKKKDENGEWVEEEHWHKGVVHGKLSESFVKYATKGALVHIVGEIRYFYIHDEQKKTKIKYTSVIVHNYKIAAYPKSSSNSAGSSQPYENKAGYNNHPQQDPNTIPPTPQQEEEDLPF